MAGLSPERRPQSRGARPLAAASREVGDSDLNTAPHNVCEESPRLLFLSETGELHCSDPKPSSNLAESNRQVTLPNSKLFTAFRRWTGQLLGRRPASAVALMSLLFSPHAPQMRRKVHTHRCTVFVRTFRDLTHPLAPNPDYHDQTLKPNPDPGSDPDQDPNPDPDPDPNPLLTSTLKPDQARSRTHKHTFTLSKVSSGFLFFPSSLSSCGGRGLWSYHWDPHR